MKALLLGCSKFNLALEAPYVPFVQLTYQCDSNISFLSPSEYL